MGAPYIYDISRLRVNIGVYFFLFSIKYFQILPLSSHTTEAHSVLSKSLVLRLFALIFLKPNSTYSIHHNLGLMCLLACQYQINHTFCSLFYDAVSKSDNTASNRIVILYVILTVHILVSVYHPTYAFCNTPFMTYINSCTFRHRGQHLGAERCRS